MAKQPKQKQPDPAGPPEPAAVTSGPPEIPSLSSAPPDKPIPLPEAGGTEAPPPPPSEPGTPEPQRKRRHRRSRVEMEQAKAAQQADAEAAKAEDVKRAAEAIGVTFRVGFDVVARSRGPHWALTDEEVSALGTVWAAALAPYLDKIGDKLPWLAVAGTTLGVLAPRIMQDRKAAEEAGKAPERKAEPTAS